MRRLLLLALLVIESSVGLCVHAQVPDPSFEATILGTASIEDVLAHSSGKFYVSATATKAGDLPVPSQFFRLNADGSLDQSYTLGAEINGQVHRIIELDDHRIALIGGFSTIEGQSRRRIAILHSDGSLDSSFAPPPGAILDTPQYVWRDPKGAIFVCCTGRPTQSYDVRSRERKWTFPKAIVKLTEFGEPDPEFVSLPGALVDESGQPIGNSDEIGATYITPLSDGTLLVAGTFNQYGGVPSQYVARISSRGHPDPEFESPCGIPVPYSSYSGRFYTPGVYCGTKLPNGSIVLGGLFSLRNEPSHAAVARFTNEGVFDPSFRILFTGSEAPPSVHRIGSDTSGRIILTGRFYGIERSFSTGAAIVDFDGRKVLTNLPFGDASFSVRFDGYKVFGGRGYYNTTGEIQPSLIGYFDEANKDELFKPQLLREYHPDNVVALPNAEGILVSGRGIKEVNGVSFTGAVMLTESGENDAGFNVQISPPNGVSIILPLPDGSFFIAGQFNYINGTATNNLAIISRKGELLRNFTPVEAPVNSVEKACLMPDGRILLYGWFLSENGNFTRQLKILDLRFGRPLFDPSFRVTTQDIYPISTLAVQSDGRILVAGLFINVDGSNISRLARLNVDGSIDYSFNPLFGVSGDIRCVAVDLSDRILVGGSFNKNGLSKHLIRLLHDGSLDASFSEPPGLLGVYSIVVRNDYRIIIKGSFSSSSGVSGAIGQLFDDGTIDPSFAQNIYNFEGFELAPPDTLWVWGTITRIQGTEKPGIVKLKLAMPIAPVVSISPSTYTAFPGEEVTLVAMSKGRGETFQWFKDNQPLSGETSNQLRIASAADSDAGTYAVHVTNAYGTTIAQASLSTDGTKPEPPPPDSTPTPNPTPPYKNTSRPELKINLPRRIHSDTRQFKLSRSDLSLSKGVKLQYKLGKGQFRAAAGNRKWLFKLKLKAGRNVIFIQAVDKFGMRSKKHKLVVFLSK